MSNKSLGRKPRNIRSSNRKLIIDLFRKHKSLSVSEISDKIKLSRTTVMKINETLLREKIIIEAGKGSSTDEGGKKPSVFALNKNKHIILTYHIEYRQIRFCIFNLALECLYSENLSIQKDAPFSDILEGMKKLYEKVSDNSIPADAEVLSLMVAVLGIVDSEKGVCKHSTYFPSWDGNLRIKDLVKNSIKSNIPIYVDNWIRFNAYAELNNAWLPGNQNIVLVNAGWHGLTAGILVNGVPYKGHHYISGEIGHMILDLKDQITCACGAKGCFESLVGCKRLVTEALDKQKEYPGSFIFKGHIDLSSDMMKRILAGADRNDTLACSLLDKRIDIFAQGLANICVVFDPDQIVLEGEYSNECGYFQNNLTKRLQNITLPRMHKDVILGFRETRAEFPQTLEGAAAYAVDTFFINAD